MDGFTYNNIFDTKGIEYIVVIAFLLLLIPFWLVLNRKTARRRLAQQISGVLNAEALHIPQGLYFGKNHTWAFLERSGLAKIGLDDLLLKITGEIDVQMLKNEGDQVKKGDAVAEIIHEGKTLRMLSPLSGEIANVNAALDTESDLLNADPYGKGWIFRLKPAHWVKETHTLHFAANATEWFRREISRYKDFLSTEMQNTSEGNYQSVLQDGGELMQNSLSGMPEELWNNFQKEFLDEA